MQSSGMYALSESSQLEYVRNCILVVIGHPRIVCVQKLYNYNGIIYKYRVKWHSNIGGRGFEGVFCGLSQREKRAAIYTEW